MKIINRQVEYRASERLGRRLAVDNVNIINVMLFEELENVIREVERNVSGSTVRQNTNPDCGTTGNCLAIAVLSLLLSAKALGQHKTFI